jgi:predicted phosphodiesterase
MKAILSDIHSNLEALRAVLDDIARHPVEAVYCLGDIVGYGPNPRECLDLVMQRCAVVVMGNHDLAVLQQPLNFSPVAEASVYWTRAQLQAPISSQQDAERRWAFLDRLPCGHQEAGGLLFVHGSSSDPVLEYVFPHDVYDRQKMRRLFAEVERCCFQGHTHVPGIFTEAGEFFSPGEVDGVYRLGGPKVLCNVGSVGQPRDGDLWACYVLLDGNTVRYRRVAYDWEATARKIYAAEGLDDSLGDRLCGATNAQKPTALCV